LPGSPTQSVPSRSLSPRQSEPSESLPPVIPKKRQRDASTSDLDDDDSEPEVIEVPAAKAQRINTNAGRPKAADYDDVAKELILSAANTYRVLLVSQGAFPTSSEELELVKGAWKRVNDDSELSPMALTPDIVRIVSKFLYPSFSFALTVNTISRSRLEALKPVARRKLRQLLLLKHYMALTVGEVRRQLPKTVKKQKN
jgi:hypothetical protein